MKSSWENFEQQAHGHLPALFIKRILERERRRPTNVLRCSSANISWRKLIAVSGMSSLSRSDKIDAFSLIGGETPRLTSLKVNVVKEEPYRRMHRGRCRRSRDVKGRGDDVSTSRPWRIQKKKVIVVIGYRDARSLSPLSQAATQQVHRAKWDSLRARRESGDHQMKVYLRLRPPRRVFHALLFFFGSSKSLPLPLHPRNRF